GGLAEKKLRRGVGPCTGRGTRIAAADDMDLLGEAEVGHFDRAVADDEEVLRLQIEMGDLASRVREFHSQAEAVRPLQCALLLDRSGIDPFAQRGARAAVDVLEKEKLLV